MATTNFEMLIISLLIVANDLFAMSEMALVKARKSRLQYLAERLTHHDILEAIAGEIPFNEREIDPLAVPRQDGPWLLDGMLPVERFKEIFNLESLPGEKRDAYQTLGGFVFTQMGRLPLVSDSFHWNGLRFDVVDMDGQRIGHGK